MVDFVLRRFTSFNALEMDCSECKCIASLQNPKCLSCVNHLNLNFDLLELRKEFSTIYYDKGLSSSIHNDNFLVSNPSIVPNFLNFYIIPTSGKKLVYEESNFKIFENNNGIKNISFNPIEYNLEFYDLKLLNNLVTQFQNEEIEIREVSKALSPELFSLFSRYTNGMGVVDEFLTVEDLQDIYINSPGNSCLFFNHSKFGQLSSNVFLKNEMVNKISSMLRTKSGRPFDEAYPVLHSDINKFSSRVCGVTNPLSFNGSGFAIRRHTSNPITLSKLMSSDFLSSEVAGLLWFLIDSEISFLITGPRGSGKTTLLGSLLFEIGKHNRLIIIEDTKELPVNHMKRLGFNIEHLRTNSFENSESFEWSSETALRTALRLGESVLVLGEVRGSEAKTLFEAMRIGAAGNSVIGTIHGSSAYDTFDRIVNDLNVPPTSFKATDVVLVCSYIKQGYTKERKLIGVTEVNKEWTKNPIFNDIVSYNPKKKKYFFNYDSELLKRISFNYGWSVKKCLENISLRTKIINFIVKKGLFSPENIVKTNNLFYSLVNNFDYKTVLRKFKASINVSNFSTEFKDNIIINSLFSLNATSSKSGITSSKLFKSLNGKISRSNFNNLLYNMENEGLINSKKLGNFRNWYLSKKMSKFLKQ